MTNFYIILEPEKKEYMDENGGNMEGIENINDIVTFDFKEGLINSFCNTYFQLFSITGMLPILIESKIL